MHNNENKFKIKKLFEVLSDITPLFFWILVIFCFNNDSIASLTLLSIVIHESGHFLCLFLLRKRTHAFRSRLSGLLISSREIISYNEEFVLFSSGIAANLLAIIVINVIFPTSNHFKEDFSAVNLLCALSNLLPVSGHDGYGMLKALLHRFGAEELAARLLPMLSILLTTIISILSLYLLVRIGEGYWIYGIFFVNAVKELKKMTKQSF